MGFIIDKISDFFHPSVKVGNLVINHKRKRIEQFTLTDGGLNIYSMFLQFNPKRLNGKMILDIGPGKTEAFSRETAKYGATVYSISPAYTSKKARERVSSQPDWQKRSVVARAQQIPFKDETFDLITALFSVSRYVESEDEELLIIKEMTRVLKPNGLILIEPHNKNKHHETEVWYKPGKWIQSPWLREKSKQYLKENGYWACSYKGSPLKISKSGLPWFEYM